MATKKKAARKRKKVTKHKPNLVPVIEDGEYSVRTEELEHAKAQARKEGFKNGWEAAKLDGAAYLCRPNANGKHGVVSLQPKTARVVWPLLQERLRALKGADEAQGQHHWVVAGMLDLDPFGD